MHGASGPGAAKHSGGRGRPRVRPRAVLDTSAWVAAHRATVAANLFDLFNLYVPQTVADEIMAGNPAFPTWEFPYATLFRILRPRVTIVPADAVTPLSSLDAGEAAALALAQAQQALVLVNEWRAIERATGLGLQPVTVPTVIVRLHLAELISRRAAHRKLDLIERITAESYIRDARHRIDSADLA